MVFCKIPARYVYIAFAFFGTFNLYSLRINLSVAIVDMVDFNRDAENDNETFTITSNSSSAMYSSGVTIPGDAWPAARENDKFVWSASQQGLLLSCYYYGYIVTQVLGAYLGRRFGRVRVLGTCTIGSSILTLLFPVISRRVGFAAAVVTRILIGFLSGVTMPTLYASTSAWAPDAERSKFVSIQFAGVATGTFAVLPVAGFLAAALGWDSVFYATGCFGLLWAIIFLALIFDEPKVHPRLSAKEKRLFLGPDYDEKQNKSSISRPVPWSAILTSKAWICLAFTHFASLFGKYQLMAMLPSYLKTMLDFDVKSTGILSSIPFLLGALLLFASGPLADCLIAQKFRSIVVRKILTTIGLLTSSISITIVTYIGPSVPAAMTLFTLSVAMDSLVVPGFKACLMEIAPDFSGIVYGMSNTVATLSGILAPQATGALRQTFEEDPLTGWRASFWIGGIIYLLGAIVFLVFGTNEKQLWAYEEDKDEEEELSQLKPAQA